jgi:2-phospho-L-lactate guanylyltransferase (CobY/MobA/RfbA family)
VPAKRFAIAKRRLSPVLGGAERADLAHLMFQDALDALTLCEADLAGVVVVAADEEAAALAKRRHAIVVSDEGRNGMNAAIRLGLACVVDHGDA